MKKIIDVSLTISKKLVIWKNDPKVKIREVQSLKKGDKVNLTEIKFGVHTGTHIDAPSHFLKNGKTVDKLDINNFFGQVSVIEIKNKKVIEPEDLKNKILCDKVLFKTDNSKFWLDKNHKFTTNYTTITANTAKYLVSKKIKLVGIDYLSIGRTGIDNDITHKILLRNNIIILEGLNLSKVEEGLYEIICAPLKIKECEGSPARVFLIK